MADDSLFEQFLTGTRELSGVDFTGATGINASSLGAAIIGSILASIAAGVSGVVDAIFAIPVRVLGGIQTFIAGERVPASPLGGAVFEFEGGLIGALFGGLDTAIETAFDTAEAALASFGPLAFAVAIGVLVLGYYALQLGLEVLEG